MTEALISDLSAIRNLRVISRTWVMQFKETTLGLPDIATALAVDEIIEGAVLRTDTALRLDPSLAEAHTVRAWLAMSLEHDWTAAEASFQRALQLNPGYATAH
ncbi:MAG: hypothetical protein H0W53_08270, partial [Acidobacteria bacterium]|nr:hypothetical protein [Acidobacteriota bacterium]